MRRTVRLRTTLYALIAAPLLLAALPARAEDEALVVSIVTGLAPGDLLNIRATASAIGKVEARLPNGVSMKNLGCNDVNGAPWCKVEELDNPKVSGWAPARYLIPTNPQPVADADAELVGEGASATDAATAVNQPPPDLTSRLGGTDQATGSEATQNSAAAITKAAIEDAYRLALAANQEPSTGAIPAPAPDAQSIGVPCARYVGQPMTSCGASVIRTGNTADVTVTWPDGGTRVISFNDGLPTGSDTQGEFRFTREGKLNMIRVGVSERFEITDALAFGD